MPYRPDLDGLRAVAVVAVVAYHAFPEFIPGGFVGVDVFFVISGFLITGIIVDGLQRDAFSFAGFYARRIRRIFPALVIVLAACLVAGWFLLFADRYKNLGKHVAGGAGFVANILYWREAGYFDAAADTKPLLHLWSLGVEEQFYLFWPLMLVLAWRRRANLLGLAAAALIVSLGYNLVRIRWDLIGTFYLPHTRLWELMAGAVLAIQDKNAAPAIGRRARAAASIAGFAAIVIAVLVIDRSRHFPGWWALLPVGGSCLLTAAGEDAPINRRLLSLPLIVGVGLISYPLYLWHWPLLSFARILNGATPTVMVRVALVAVACALAWITYRVLEVPIRFGAQAWRRLAVPVCSVVMAAIGAAGFYTFTENGLARRTVNLSSQASFAQAVQDLRREALESNYRVACDFSVRNPIDASCVAPAGAPSWFLWGDSHAQALARGIETLLPPGTRLSQIATSSCDPSLAATGDDSRGCVTSNRAALDAIRATRPAVVIVAQKDRHERTDWDAVASRLRALGVQRVIVVGPLPMWQPNLPDVVSRNWGRPFDRVSEGLIADRADIDRRLATRFADSKQVTYVSMIAKLCNTGGCLARIPGNDPWSLMTFDDGHLTTAASDYVAAAVLAPVLR
jgi:peptidoglycan/LPS O-acetylase OafA/YrhL